MALRRAAITRDSTFYVGGEGWIVNLSSDIDAINHTASHTAATVAIIDEDFMAKKVHSAEVALELPVLLAGANSDRLEDNLRTRAQRDKATYAFAISGKPVDNNHSASDFAYFEGGATSYLSVAHALSTTDIFKNNVTFMPSGDWIIDRDIYNASSISGAKTVALGDFAGTDFIYLIVYANTKTSTTDIAVGDVTYTLAASGVGIYELPNTHTGAITGKNLTVAAGAGVSAWVLIGTRVEVNR